MTKQCFKCLEEKKVTEFYKHSKMKDGYVGKCKECAKKDVRAHRKENIDKVRAYDRVRNRLPHRVMDRVAYKKTENGKLSSYKGTKKYRKKHPLRKAAMTIVGNALRSGRLEREPCSVCDDVVRVHAHHEDYYKPLEVIWLCHKHHRGLHTRRP